MSAPAAPTAPLCAVPRCHRPVEHIVCWGCLDGLRRDLRDLPELLADLEVTLTRQDVSGGEAIPEPPEEARTKDGPPAAASVLPFRPMASDVGRYLHATLDHWTAHLLAALGITEADAFGGPAHPIPAQRTVGELAARRWVARAPSARTLELAAWIERHPHTIATDPEAGALVENVRWAVEDARRVVFPRQLVFVGPCECGAGLFAPAGADSVRCRECDRGWKVDEVTRWYREQAEGVLLSAEDMSRALPRLAADITIKPLTSSQIRGFGRRGRLAEYRPDPRTWSVGEDGRPVPPPPRYKVADVIALMRVLLEEEQAREARRARVQSASAAGRVAAAHQRLKEALRA